MEFVSFQTSIADFSSILFVPMTVPHHESTKNVLLLRQPFPQFREPGIAGMFPQPGDQFDSDPLGLVAAVAG